MTTDLDDIFEEDWPEDHRSGVIAVVGRPNVGKSTLINRILGQKIAIVTDKPQTTRKQQLGIYTQEHGQILFIDTPGLHRPHHKLGEYMVGVAEQAIRDADLILWVVDVSVPPQEGDVHIAETLKRVGRDTPIVLALNKADQLSGKGDAEIGLGIIWRWYSTPTLRRSARYTGQASLNWWSTCCPSFLKGRATIPPIRSAK
jgi:small GTP-binding protein